MKHVKRILSLALAVALSLTAALALVPGVALAAGNYTADSAIDIPLGTTMTGTADIEANNSQERGLWYKVTTPEKGSLYFDLDYTVLRGEFDNGSDLYFKFYWPDESGQLVSPEVNGLLTFIYMNNRGVDQGAISSNKYRLPSGTYYMQIQSLGVSDIKHEFVITPHFTAEGSGYETEFNNTKETATQVEPGVATVGNIAVQRDEDWFRFTAPSDGNAKILFESTGAWRGNVFADEGLRAGRP